MQHIGSSFMSGLKGLGANFLSFSFNDLSDTAQTQADFSKAIDQSILNLENNNKKIDELNMLVNQALHAIDKNIETLKLQFQQSEESQNINTDEIQNFAVLNIVDAIIDNIANVNSVEELASKLKEKGVSSENINSILQQLHIPTQLQTPYTQELNSQAEASDFTTQDNFEIINKQQAIKTFYEASKQQENNNFAEKINLGDDIQPPKQNNLNIETKEPQTPASDIIKNTEEQSSIQTQSEEKSKSKIQDLVSKFMSTKENTELSSQEEQAIKNQLNKTEKLNSKNLSTEKEVIANQIQKEEFSKVTETQTNKSSEEIVTIKTKAEKEAIQPNEHSSQYKSLKAKAVSETPTDSTPEQVINKSLESENSQSETDNKNISLESKFTNNQFTGDITSDENSFEAFVNEKSAVQQNKNLDLYKLAQQANVQSQINVAIKQFKSSNTRQIQLRLHPEELGNVNIELDISDSSTRGVITVESPELAKHLAQNLKDVFQGFKDAGFEINNKDFEIKVDDQQSQHKSSQNQHQATNDEESESRDQTRHYTLQEDSIDIKV